jgi:hypothetical protein
MDLPNKTAVDGSSVAFGVDEIDGEKAEKDKFGNSTPTIASARSISSKDKIPSNRDSQLPSEPANPTEKTGNGFSSALGTGSATKSRTVVRSELMVVGTVNDKVLISQGLEIRSNAAVNVTFVGPETLKVTQRSDISLQKEEKEIYVPKKQASKDTDYSACYKGF